ncbi:hypothetical protein [Streptomyces sp. DH10]|nr:hypothetical protein [Streptomyces sp. DH10]MDG9714773.1 hypothetical protein [Streptomyces sp. DH10]
MAWLEIVQTALDLPGWMPMLSLTGTARLRHGSTGRRRLITGPVGHGLR